MPCSPSYFRSLARFVLALGLATLPALASAVTPKTAGLDADRIYQTTNIWTIHLSFAADQWEAMEPKGGFGPFGGGPGPGPGGPGAPGGGFSLAQLISPAFLDQGDTNRDQVLSRDEFSGLAGKWFQAWNTNQSGSLDAAQIRKGINSLGGGPGPGAGPRPGGGMMLQGAEGKRNGLASAMGIEFVYVRADLEFDGRTLKDVGVRYKGNGTFLESRGSLKRSLKIDLNRNVEGQKLGDVSMLNLQNNVTDPAWMNEVLAYRLYRDAGVPAPRTAYARVFITVPGKFDRKYFGLYSLSENVDKPFAAHAFGTKKGALFKPVTPNLFTDLGADWFRYNQTYDPKNEPTDEQKKAVIDLSRLVTHATDGEFAAQIGRFVDLPEFAKYLAVTVWLTDIDGLLGPGQNFYLHHHPRTGLFQFIAWDQDHSFGQMPRFSQEQREQLSIQRPWQGENRFLERLSKVDAFKQLYLAKLDEFGKTLFQPARFTNQVDALAPILRAAVQEEKSAKLARFDQAVAGETLPGGGFGPFGGGPGLKPIKPFAAARTASVLDQLAGRSTGKTMEGFGVPGGGPRAEGAQGQSGGPGESFGIGMIFGGPFVTALDRDKSATISRDEFEQGFVRWFEAWNTDGTGRLTADQLRDGVNKDLAPARGGFPGFGGPPGAAPSSRAE